MPLVQKTLVKDSDSICAELGVPEGDECTKKYYPPPDSAYATNQVFNTPILAGLIGGGVTELLFGDAKQVNLPIVGNVGPGIGMGTYIALGTWVAEYFEKAQIMWTCMFSYRRFGAEVMSPLYSGFAAQAMSLLGGNDLGMDPFFIGAPSAHVAKYIANTYINPSKDYENIHKNGLIPEIKPGDFEAPTN